VVVVQVDLFLLVESKVTHSGLPKRLHWRDGGAHELRFARFLSKVYAVALDHLDGVPYSSLDGYSSLGSDDGPHAARGNSSSSSSSSNDNGNEPGAAAGAAAGGLGEGRVAEAVAAAMLAREEAQRNAIAHALRHLPQSALRGRQALQPHDLVLVSDVDEVPRRAAIEALKQRWPQGGRNGGSRGSVVAPVRLIMDWYLYSLDFVASRPWGLASREGPYAVPLAMLVAPAPHAKAAAAKAADDGGSAEAGPADRGLCHVTGTASQWRRAFRGNEAAALRCGNSGVESPCVAEGLGVWSTLGGAGWHLSSFGGVAAVKLTVCKPRYDM
jgi:hypothetical protein